MKYAYKGVTGTTEVDVDELLHDTLVAMDREEYNSERRHSRRHPVSLDEADYEGEWFEDEVDLLDNFLSNETFFSAMSNLSERQRYLIQKICLDGWKYTDLAALEGKDESAIRHAVKRAKEKIKKFYADRPI